MLKRFVTYIYQYDRGNRGSNVGFVKTDIRDAGCRMEIHLRGLERFQGKARVYLIVPGENAIGVPAGELHLNQGAGQLKLAYARNLLGASGFSVNQIQAVIIRYGGGRLLASCWAEQVPQELLLGKFDVWGDTTQPETEETAQEPVSDNTAGTRALTETETQSDTDQMEPDASPFSQDEVASGTRAQASGETDATTQMPGAVNANIQTADAAGITPQEENISSPDLSAVSSEIAVDDKQAPPCPCQNTMRQTITEPEPPRDTAPPQITYRKIAITDIRTLPKRNWYLCNNSFLIHGFFNYHHLILKTVECDGQTKSYLGVPGIYEQPERMMAIVFGFPVFEPARAAETASDTDAAAADAPPDSYDIGVFGYWMLPLMN